ncbi:MAG: hypothetical protein WC250_03860, partial [Candidatus Paceibacterota bacterium]
MKLFEFRGKLPARAGKAELRFGNPTHADFVAFRDGKTIRLVGRAQDEFYPLLDGRQFIYRAPNDVVFFGGTDEEPFLVQLSRRPMDVFIEDGEEAFFESLFPDQARLAEKLFGTKTVRQGDIFATPVGIPWEELERYEKLFSGREIPVASGKSLSPVLSTRHRLKGRIHLTKVFGISDGQVGEGLLSAPDHESKELKGVHTLHQTSYL